ncbi:hypothetical protein RRG08_020816 [Elysia crispata]|uniref:Uncharacterized protein n=1 Tax=Elysia crispata TaxID=231223 RepID=A0AAE0XVR6_9GAST|nr:hypothetical protein RRG08_020816 [Elysia crispata]
MHHRRKPSDLQARGGSEVTRCRCSSCRAGCARPLYMRHVGGVGLISGICGTVRSEQYKENEIDTQKPKRRQKLEVSYTNNSLLRNDKKTKARLTNFKSMTAELTLVWDIVLCLGSGIIYQSPLHGRPKEREDWTMEPL